MSKTHLQYRCFLNQSYEQISVWKIVLDQANRKRTVKEVCIIGATAWDVTNGDKLKSLFKMLIFKMLYNPIVLNLSKATDAGGGVAAAFPERVLGRDRVLSHRMLSRKFNKNICFSSFFWCGIQTTKVIMRENWSKRVWTDLSCIGIADEYFV